MPCFGGSVGPLLPKTALGLECGAPCSLADVKSCCPGVYPSPVVVQLHKRCLLVGGGSRAVLGLIQWIHLLVL